MRITKITSLFLLTIIMVCSVCFAENKKPTSTQIEPAANISATPVTEAAVIIKKIIGSVEVLKAGSAEWIAVKGSVELSEGDMIRTVGIDSAASIQFSDGATVDITNESTLSIPELRKSKEEVNKKTVLDVKSGCMKAIFEKLQPGEKSHFEVRTPTSVCGVLGTTIYIDTSTGTVYVSEGTLIVRDMVSGVEYTVGAGQIINISTTGEVTRPQGATEEQTKTMVDNFKPLDDVEVLGYTVPGGEGEGDTVIFTPDPEEAASRV